MAEKPLHSYRHPHPAVAVDVVIFSYTDEQLRVLLIRRAIDPFKGSWALPGGFVKPSEDLLQAAQRELEEETGLSGVEAQQVGAFGAPDRDPRERVVSVAYSAVVRYQNVQLRAGTDAAAAAWHSMKELPRLAFDHAEIIACAHDHLIQNLDRSAVSVRFLPAEFTLTELQKVHEAVRGTEIDKRNFRKWVAASGLVQPTRKSTVGAQHRPARIYRGIGRHASGRR